MPRICQNMHQSHVSSYKFAYFLISYYVRKVLWELWIAVYLKSAFYLCFCIGEKTGFFYFFKVFFKTPRTKCPFLSYIVKRQWTGSTGQTDSRSFKTEYQIIWYVISDNEPGSGTPWVSFEMSENSDCTNRVAICWAKICLSYNDTSVRGRRRERRGWDYHEAKQLFAARWFPIFTTLLFIML